MSHITAMITTSAVLTLSVMTGVRGAASLEMAPKYTDFEVTPAGYLGMTNTGASSLMSVITSSTLVTDEPLVSASLAGITQMLGVTLHL